MPCGFLPTHVRRFHVTFIYHVGPWNNKRRVVAKVEWHPGERYTRVGFIVTNRSRLAEPVVALAMDLKVTRETSVSKTQYGHTLDQQRL